MKDFEKPIKPNPLKRPKRYITVSTPFPRERRELLEGLDELSKRLRAGDTKAPHYRQHQKSNTAVALIKAGLKRNKDKIVDNFGDEEEE